MPDEYRHLDKIRFDIAKEDIQVLFSESQGKIYSPSDLYLILSSQRKFWRLSEKTSAKEFIGWLLQETALKEHKFPFPSRVFSRFTWGEFPLYPVVLTLRPTAYFSHYSAVYLHDLTDQIPKTIYLNYEQPPKPKNEAPLIQESVDRAFKSKMRKSNAIAEHGDYKIFLLNGMHTGRLGVVEHISQDGFVLPVTDIERTLIDITVRPSYSGGPHEVLKAYRKAAGRFSVNRLTAILKKLDFKYPYHQSIGFYLERSGKYKPSALALLDSLPKTIDFYLDYNMKKTGFSEKWRLYYPLGF